MTDQNLNFPSNWMKIMTPSNDKISFGASFLKDAQNFSQKIIAYSKRYTLTEKKVIIEQILKTIHNVDLDKNEVSTPIKDEFEKLLDAL